MNSQERRKAITDMLENASAPISATKLAVEFSVTRQIIVADIALLRASGLCIVSDNKGYSMGKNPVQDGMIKRIVVKHKQDDVSDEFYALTLFAA